MAPISKTFIGKESGVKLYEYIFASPTEPGTTFRVVGPDPLGPIDPSQPVKWNNTAAMYGSTK